MQDNTSNIDWRNQLMNLVITTIGLLLAFFLNSWNETRKEVALAEEQLQGIVTELKQNLKEAEEAVPYHSKLLEKLRTEPLKANLILKPPALKDHAWRLAENNNFKKHTDRELYYKISECYDIQQFIMDHVHSAGDMMMQLNVLGPHYLIGAASVLEENSEQFETYSKSGWIPVFETWTAFEKHYAKEIREILLENNLASEAELSE